MDEERRRKVEDGPLRLSPSGSSVALEMGIPLRRDRGTDQYTYRPLLGEIHPGITLEARPRAD